MGRREADDAPALETKRWVVPLLDRVRVTMRVVIGRMDLPLSKAMTLKPGDVLTFLEPVYGRVDLAVDETSIGSGELVDVGGRRGVRVIDVDDGGP